MANEQPKKIETRRQFVKQVADTLSVKSEGTKEAFVFGISGRWGEGKSFFLDDLEKELHPIPVVRINPWKYAQDQKSLMRSFLNELFKKKSYHWLPRHYYRWRLRLKTLEYDFSTKNIRYSVFLALSAITFALIWWWYYSEFFPELKLGVIQNKGLLVVIAIPLAIAAAQAMTVSQRSSKSVETIDKFDEIFENILRYSYPKKKNYLILNSLRKTLKNPNESTDPEIRRLVVFVDDLDRLTAEKAISVLDTLRTFFDKEDLAFVVACDHTIMEEHLGRRLKPNESSINKQKEEGRRFLQKMFNVYWRLPLPTEAEMKGYIGWLISENTEQGRYLRSHITGDDLTTLQLILFDFFEKNFRHVNRFVDRLVFTLRVVDSQEKTSGTKVLSTQPMLIVRVLLLEALTNPLFEQILNNPSILEDLEELHYKNEPARITDKLSILNYAEVSHQQLIQNILSSTEGFFDENGFRASVEDYIYLASNSNEEDKSGLAPADFLHILQNNPEDILPAILRYKTRSRFAESLSSATDRTATASADAFYATFQKITDAMSGAPSDNSLHQPILDAIDNEAFFVDFNRIPVEKQIDFLKSIDKWINGVDEIFPFDQIMHVCELIASKLDVTHIKNIVHPEGDILGKFISDAVFLWFTEKYTSDPASALAALSPRINTIQPQTLNSYSVRLAEPMLERLIQETDVTHRSAELKIILHSNGHIAELQNRVIDGIKHGNETAWSIYVELSAINSDGATVVQIDQAQQAIIAYISSSDTENDLITTLNFANGKLTGNFIDNMWMTVLEEKNDIFRAALHSLLVRYNYEHLSPSSEISLKIIDMVLDVIDFDETRAQQMLSYVRRSNWLFAGVQKLRKSRITPRLRDNVRTIQGQTKDALKVLVNEWGG